MQSSYIQEQTRLEENQQSQRKERELAIERKIIAGKLQHYLAVSLKRYEPDFQLVVGFKWISSTLGVYLLLDLHIDKPPCQFQEKKLQRGADPVKKNLPPGNNMLENERVVELCPPWFLLNSLLCSEKALLELREICLLVSPKSSAQIKICVNMPE